jgi:hypothetical protein
VDYLFWHVFHWAITLALGGLVVLVVLIPLIGKVQTFTTVRTELFSARAAYWCVIAGLAILLIMSASVAVRFAMMRPAGAP